jgi:hypothetical protein
MSRDDEDGGPRCVWCGKGIDFEDIPICPKCLKNSEDDPEWAEWN